MKSLTTTLWALTVGSALALAAEPMISLSLTAVPSSVTAGDRITLKILITNGTDHMIELGHLNATDGQEIEYRFEVRDSQGAEVPFTRHGRALNGKPDKGDENLDCGDCSGFGQDLLPGEKTTAEIVISKIYELSKPGKYTIQASRVVGDNANRIIKSNPVTVTVK